MPYILKTQSNDLFLVDYSIRNGLHYRNFHAKQMSRPVSITTNSTDQYTATIDSQNQMHFICKNTKNQIMHFLYKNGVIDKKILLDDSNNTYNISNLFVSSLQDQLHLFYTAKSPIKSTNELIHQVLSSDTLSSPHSVASLPNLNTPYDCIVHDKKVYLLFICNENGGSSLQTRIFDMETNEWSSPVSVTTSEYPISQCKLCIDRDEVFHIIYTLEVYGQYQIIYKKKTGDIWSDEALLHATASPLQPTLFIYHDALWINWLENEILKMVLSVDKGETFSTVVDCSPQESKLGIYYYTYPFSDEQEELFCTKLYGTDSPSPRFCILHRIDMDHIHPDLSPNTELELFIAGLTYSDGDITPPISSNTSSPSNTSSDYQKLLEENNNLKQTQENIVAQYENTAELAKKIQNEGKKWKEQCLEAEKKAKYYEKEITQLKMQLQSYQNPRNYQTTDIE